MHMGELACWEAGVTMDHTTKPPHPVDTHVGARMRMRRLVMGLSQNQLGTTLKVTFQQIQKYEKGTNRIGASRLFEIAGILNVNVQYFYTGLNVAPDLPGLNDDADEFMALLSTPEGIQLCQNFFEIRDPAVKRCLLDLVKTLADEATDEPKDEHQDELQI